MSAPVLSPLLLDWQPVVRNTLRGFARVQLPSGMILNDVAVHQANGAAWASPAAKPMLGRDGMAMKDAATGKIKYAPIIEFASKETRDRFSRAVIEALLAVHPQVLQ